MTPRIVAPVPGVKGKWFKSNSLSPIQRDVMKEFGGPRVQVV